MGCIIVSILRAAAGERSRDAHITRGTFAQLESFCNMIGRMQLDVDIKMAGNKRYKKSIPLFQPIEPDNSSFEPLSTKVEIKLKKGRFP